MNNASTLIALLSVSVLIGRCLCDCELPIRRRTVASAWHSSHGYGQLCFQMRPDDDENRVLNASGGKSQMFIHSSDSEYANGGFHWFAVQLKESVLIRSVTVKGRVEAGQAATFGRSVGIEIWTSSSSEQLFSGDHCWTRNMSGQFRERSSSWKRCGVTVHKSAEIAAAENFTVHCGNEARYLLLRRNTSLSFSNDDRGDLSIADLTLRTAPLISLQSSDSCLDLSNVIVQLKRSIYRPWYDCQASASVDGVDQQLTLQSQNASAEGSVLWWKLDSNLAEGQKSLTVSIECRSAGCQPVRVTETLSACASPKPDVFRVLIIGSVASAGGILAIGALLLAAKIRGRNAAARQEAQVRLKSLDSRLVTSAPSMSGCDAAADYENSGNKLEDASGVYVT